MPLVMNPKKTKVGRAQRASVPEARRRVETLLRYAAAQSALTSAKNPANRAIKISRKEARRRVAKMAKRFMMPVPDMSFE